MPTDAELRALVEKLRRIATNVDYTAGYRQCATDMVIELESLLRPQEPERAVVTCKDCNGLGERVDPVSRYGAPSRCRRCNGTGKTTEEALAGALRALDIIGELLAPKVEPEQAARERLIESARHLAKQYESEGNGVGVAAAEDRLIADVKALDAAERRGT